MTIFKRIFKKKLWVICCVNRWTVIERFTLVEMFAHTKRGVIKAFKKRYPSYVIIEVTEKGKEHEIFYE